ncbi:MAG: hypothetical protein AAGA56_28135, partial [Myxococcota bacterium]
CECTYSVGDDSTEGSGDLFYASAKEWVLDGVTYPSWCSAPVANHLSRNFGLDGPGWKVSGWGGGECNVSKPWGRAMSAAAGLFMAAPNLVSRAEWLAGTSALLVNWAPWWVQARFDDTHGECFSGSNGDGTCFNALASANRGTGRVNLYIRNSVGCGEAFFAGTGPQANVGERMGLYVHEARHLDGVGHANSAGQDQRWGDGGAWDFHIQYLIEFAFLGTDEGTELNQRCRAAERAWGRADFFYVEPVAFPLDIEPGGCP